MCCKSASSRTCQSPTLCCFLLIDNQGWIQNFEKMGAQNIFTNSFPLCGILMVEFLCYRRFRCFLKLNFLVVDMFNACVLYLSKKIIRQLIKKGGCVRCAHLNRSQITVCIPPRLLLYEGLNASPLSRMIVTPWNLACRARIARRLSRILNNNNDNTLFFKDLVAHSQAPSSCVQANKRKTWFLNLWRCCNLTMHIIILRALGVVRND